MPDERKAIHAYLSVQHHDAWHDAADEMGVSLSGLLESMGAKMLQEGDSWLAEFEKPARKIDVARRRRGPR